MTELLTTPTEVDDDFIDTSSTNAESDGRPKIHAKHLTLMVTAGTEDRDRTIEEFYAEVQAAILTIANVKRITLSSNYYILDGKVCLPRDYDAETQDRKPGTFPPPWAGGPAPQRVKSEEPKEESAVDRGLSRVRKALEQASEKSESEAKEASQ